MWGRHNSIKTRLEAKNPALYTLGCPCHFLHNAAHKAANEYESACGFDIEEMAVMYFIMLIVLQRGKESLEIFPVL